ncbi:DUF6894 family protein [Bradyrhizobium cenepequi]|uniref:DUF6894 family protein n=1 Tax=Bradyrhizobium cenepequi TaxID=2821403 RepID=UPI001CE30340|nr:hypothetical protein [Bradyrhizobium cenepequi]MCA6112242.1 hypothetical protein [Bradyrhizobium cenepequi]
MLQTFRSESVFDIQKNIVRMRDIEKLIDIGGFNDVYLHQPQKAVPGTRRNVRAHLREMGTYQFHINRRGPFHDGDGMALPDAEAAWEEALRVGRDVKGNIAARRGMVAGVEIGKTIFRINLATADLRSTVP